MSRLRRFAPLPLLAALPLLVGSIQPAGAGHTRSSYFDLDKLPAPAVTGAELVKGLEEFVNAFPVRLTGTPNDLRAAQFLHDEMRGLGYTTEIRPLPHTSGDQLLRVVTATKRGTTRPDEWLVLVGHYDTIATTVYGAYDNGAGTNMIRFLAHELAKLPTNRSIMFAWYNGEEEGLLASRAHARQLRDANTKIAAVLGFDMTGIAWPFAGTSAKSCLCMWLGSGTNQAVYRPLLRHVNFEFLDFPEDRRKVWVSTTPSPRNSDERSFGALGYPVFRWAGLEGAGDYPAYHLPHDTMDTIFQTAGGRSFFEAGSLNTLTSAYYTALALDNHLPAPAIEVSVDGLAATVSGAGSSDDDGALSDFRWDFGDGTTGEGEAASHTYAAPGTYTVTLTVADNLWPEVTRSESATITVG